VVSLTLLLRYCRCYDASSCANCYQAFGLIIRTLNNEPLTDASNSNSKTYPLRLLIPTALIGSIIGKSGTRIREIQDASGARLNASDTPLAMSSERSLVVLGVADAVHIATYYVGSTLVEQLTEKFHGPSASAYATRSGQAVQPVQGGLMVIPYIPKNIGGHFGHPDNLRRNPGMRSASNPYGNPYGHGAPTAQQHPQAHAQYGSQPMVPAQGYGSAQQPAQGYGAAMPQMGGQVAPQQNMASAMGGQTITQQIYIPNDMVGAIIGKGGQKINEIRAYSQSAIKINEPQENSNERLVTVTGTQKQNEMALYMLYQRLGKSTSPPLL